MIYTKYCKQEHDISAGCNTLRLGTFEYYRELDPSFSIADPEEGYLHVSTAIGSEFTLRPEQWNQLFGEGMRVSNTGGIPTSAFPARRFPGDISFQAKDGTFQFNDDGTFTFSSDIDFKFYFPNSYMFCMSIEDEKNVRSPTEIDTAYNSQYYIPENKLPTFISHVRRLLSQAVRLEHLRDLDSLLSTPLADLLAQTEFQPMMGPVKYVPEKEITLKSVDDIDRNRLTITYFQSLFQKEEQYSRNREVRMIFALKHSKLGFLSVKSDPILLDLNPLLECLA